MNFEEGDHVAAGDVIAEIENDDLKAQLAGAGAALSARRNELARLKAGAREQEISAAEPSCAKPMRWPPWRGPPSNGEAPWA